MEWVSVCQGYSFYNFISFYCNIVFQFVFYFSLVLISWTSDYVVLVEFLLRNKPRCVCVCLLLLYDWCLAMVFKIQSTSAFNVGVEPKMVWMSLDCETAEAVQSSGLAELDELGLGSGDKGVQKCVIVWPWWKLLVANWCFSDFQHFPAPALSHQVCPIWGSSYRTYTALQIRYEVQLLTNWILVVKANSCKI